MHGGRPPGRSGRRVRAGLRHHAPARREGGRARTRAATGAVAHRTAPANALSRSPVLPGAEPPARPSRLRRRHWSGRPGAAPGRMRRRPSPGGRPGADRPRRRHPRACRAPPPRSPGVCRQASAATPRRCCGYPASHAGRGGRDLAPSTRAPRGKRVVQRSGVRGPTPLPPRPRCASGRLPRRGPSSRHPLPAPPCHRRPHLRRRPRAWGPGRRQGPSRPLPHPGGHRRSPRRCPRAPHPSSSDRR
jgi:hypothetical protein